MELGQYLHDLLLENETVIIPGFGAFISNYKPAEFGENNEIVPPSKEVVFNQKIRNNDGLLVAYVAKKQSVSHFDALKLIERERENIIYQLDKGERIILENVGELFRGEGNEIEFEAHIEENLLLDSFGLEPISLDEEITESEEEQEIVPRVEDNEEKWEEAPEVGKEEEPGEVEESISEEEMELKEDVVEEQQEEVLEEVASPSEEEKFEEYPEKETEEKIVPVVKETEEENIEESQSETSQAEEEKEEIAEPVSKNDLVLEDPPEEPEKKRSWIWFLVILIPLILAGLYLTKDKIFPDNSYKIQLEGEDIDNQETQENIAAVDTLKKDSIQSENADTTSQKSIENPLDALEGKFYLVGGSFKEQENVDKFMEQFDADGYEPFLLGKRGNFYIVAIGVYPTEKQAVAARDSFMDENADSGIWVYEDKQE